MPPQVDFLFAAVAGVLTAFSPCGVPFLPALWAQQSKRAATGPGPRFLLGGFLLGVGLFLVPFGAIGAILAAVVQPFTSWLVLISGFIILGFAGLTWRGVSIGGRFARFAPRSAVTRAEPVMTGFAYAMGSVGCTSPLFFAVLLFSVSSSQPLLLLAFGLSFLLPLALLAILAREFGETFRDALRKRVHLLERGIQIFLVALGAYLVAFFFAAPILGIPL